MLQDVVNHPEQQQQQQLPVVCISLIDSRLIHYLRACMFFYIRNDGQT